MAAARGWFGSRLGQAAVAAAVTPPGATPPTSRAPPARVAGAARPDDGAFGADAALEDRSGPPARRRAAARVRSVCGRRAGDAGTGAPVPSWRTRRLLPGVHADRLHRHGAGTIQIELAVVDAPRTVANFTALVRRAFQHPVAPRRRGLRRPGRRSARRRRGRARYTIRDEINQRPTCAARSAWPRWADTGGSQFFITHSPQPHPRRATRCSARSSPDGRGRRLRQWDLIRAVRICTASPDRHRRLAALRAKGGAVERPLSSNFREEATASSPSWPSSWLPSWPPSLPPSLPSVVSPPSGWVMRQGVPPHQR